MSIVDSIKDSIEKKNNFEDLIWINSQRLEDYGHNSNFESLN